jgi:hypothetical protein
MGVEPYLDTDLAERSEHVAWRVDQKADAASFDNRVVDADKKQYAADGSNHRHRLQAARCRLQVAIIPQQNASIA